MQNLAENLTRCSGSTILPESKRLVMEGFLMAGIFGGSSFGFAAAGRRRARSRCESSSRAAQTRDSRASERCREPFAGDARGQAFGVFGWDGFGMGARSPFVRGMEGKPAWRRSL